MDIARTEIARTLSASVPAAHHRDPDTDLEELQLSGGEPTNVAFRQDLPPDGGYGWVCTLSLFLINAHTWGVNSSWAVILAYYLSHDTYPGATHLQYSLVGGLSISSALILSPAVALAHRHLGMRPTLVLGSTLILVALLTSSYATKMWHLFLSQGVCFGWGMGFLYVPASAALPPWFSARRSLAVGLATSGSGIGGLLYSLATNAAIARLGIAWTYRILALCSFVAGLAASFLLREYRGRSPPVASEQQQQQQQKSSLVRLGDLGRVEVLLVAFWGMVTELGYITLLYSLPSYAATAGLTATQGSAANALLNLSLALSRPIVGYCSDAFGRINMAMGMTVLCAVLCVALWIPGRGFAALAAFALLAGGVCGTFWATVTPVLAEVVGLGMLARAFGVVCLALVLPTTFAESVALQLVDSRGGGTTQSGSSFLGVQIFVACAFTAGAAGLLLLRSWQIARTDALSSGRRAHGSLSWLTPRALFTLRRV